MVEGISETVDYENSQFGENVDDLSSFEEETEEDQEDEESYVSDTLDDFQDQASQIVSDFAD